MSYSLIENIIYVAKLTKYNRLLEKGYSQTEASIICAKEIIESEECQKDGVLEKRYNSTKDPENSFSQHIIHMDKVVKGSVNERKIQGSDRFWYKVFKK